MNTPQKPYQHQILPWKTLRQALLNWYDIHQRELPWRHTNIADANPYQTWLSEIMLQQTTVDTVIPYFKNFLKRWPAVEDLANATIDQVLHQWQGLGYYRRAHNLHACAGIVAKELNGIFPKTVRDLKALPGLGDYTAKAVASIALNQATVPIDGNVERVIARLLAIQEPFPTAKKTVQSSIIHFENDHRPGDFAQALMDLGATVCTPKKPQCMACPWQTHCAAYMQGCTEALPKKLPKKPKPKRFCSAYILRDPKERLLVEKRPDKGLLAGMTMCPTSAWSDDISTVHAPFDQIELHPIAGHIKHVFTHFELYVHVFEGQVKTLNSEGIWLNSSELKGHPLPTLMKKILLHARFNLHNTGNTCET